MCAQHLKRCLQVTGMAEGLCLHGSGVMKSRNSHEIVSSRFSSPSRAHQSRCQEKNEPVTALAKPAYLEGCILGLF
jgi:hypothetical protein